MTRKCEIYYLIDIHRLIHSHTYTHIHTHNKQQACEAAVGKGATCSLTSFAGTKSADGFCQISTDSVKDLLHGTGFVQMKYAASATPADGSEFSFTFIKVCNYLYRY